MLASTVKNQKNVFFYKLGIMNFLVQNKACNSKFKSKYLPLNHDLLFSLSYSK